MSDNAEESNGEGGFGVVSSVAIFWVAYVVLTMGFGFLSRALIDDQVVAHIVWTMLGAAGVYGVTRLMLKLEKAPATPVTLVVRSSALKLLTIGYLVGFAAFALHLLIVSVFAGPLAIERVAAVGVGAAILFFCKYFFASVMEELGFRGYALQRLQGAWGVWPAVLITSVAFGLSHLNYGWSLQSILLGVIPSGVLWAVAAVATRGIALPIGLHASWNFGHWVMGDKSDPGLFQLSFSEGAIQLTQTVAMTSSYTIYAVMIGVFWMIYRRKVRSGVDP